MEFKLQCLVLHHKYCGIVEIGNHGICFGRHLIWFLSSFGVINWGSVRQSISTSTGFSIVRSEPTRTWNLSTFCQRFAGCERETHGRPRTTTGIAEETRTKSGGTRASAGGGSRRPIARRRGGTALALVLPPLPSSAIPASPEGRSGDNEEGGRGKGREEDDPNLGPPISNGGAHIFLGPNFAWLSLGRRLGFKEARPVMLYPSMRSPF